MVPQRPRQLPGGGLSAGQYRAHSLLGCTRKVWPSWRRPALPVLVVFLFVFKTSAVHLAAYRNEAILQQQRFMGQGMPLAVGHPARGIQYAFPPIPPQQQQQLPERYTCASAQSQAYGYPAPNQAPSRRAAAVPQQRQHGYVPVGPGALDARQGQQGRQGHQHDVASPRPKLWSFVRGIFRRT